MPLYFTILKRLIVGAALAAAQISAALADGAVLMTSAICDNPRDSIDSQWFALHHGATDVFFMREDTGAVVAMNAANGFDTYADIYVVSHGNEEDVGPFPKADFAANLHAAHPTRPDKVYFDSCNTALGADTVLALTNAAYGNLVPEIFGPAGLCKIVGNGNPDLATAVSRYNAELLPENQFDAVAGNIMAIWQNGDYAGTGQPWETACRQFADDADMAGLEAFRLAVQATFLKAPVYPIGESHNYGLLIQWNTGGEEFFQCGTANGVACP